MQITKMKATAIAAALLCGLSMAGAAQAEDSSVQVYGKLYPQLTRYSVSGGTVAGTAVSTLVKPITAAATGVSTTGTAMDSSNSYIGFRGSENLGGGLSAIFQLEGAIGVDDGTSPKNVLFNRDTFVGLAGDFGSIKVGGRMDTVYKRLADQIGFFGVASGNTVSGSNILAQGGFGTSAAERFHERPTNTVVYTSPDVNGFQGAAGYSLGEIAGSTGNIYSVGGKYEAGPYYFALAYEEHIGLFGGSNNAPAAMSNLAIFGTKSDDTSLRATAQYKISSDTRVEFDIARTKLSESGGTLGHFQTYQHVSWLASAEQKLGPAWTIAGAYGRSNAGSCDLVGGVVCNTGGLEASMLNLGAAYTLSKRTKLFALFSRVANGYSANVSNGGTAPAPGPGQNVSQTSMGISHAF